MMNYGSDEVSPRTEIALLGSVETMLEKIYEKHKQHRPITVETRRRLSSISEELALETLRKVFNKQCVMTLDGLIIHLVKDMATVDGSSVQSPRTPGKKSCRLFQDRSLDLETPSPKFLRREENGGSKHIPPLLALGELEFNKAFLLLSYIGGESLGEVISGDEIRQWKDLPMVEYESAVWLRLGHRYCPQKERKRSLEGDSGKTHYYQCHVAPDGSYKFKFSKMEGKKGRRKVFLQRELNATLYARALQH